MVTYKCIKCHKKSNNEEEMMVLAEWHLGFSKIEDYIICFDCWEFNEIYENLPNLPDF